MVERFWTNGVESDGRIAVTDSSVLRGDGCFEVLRSYGGRVFALEEHLDRLERSATLLEIELPERNRIADWIGAAAEVEPDGAIRVMVSRGSALPSDVPQTQVVVFAHRWERDTDRASLMPVPAPWHGAGENWELRGAKLLSYAPNLAASRRARGQGYDDALLVTTNDVILEGPTFSVFWLRGNNLETPTLDLGILDSITRRHVIRLASGLGLGVAEGTWEVSHLSDVSEVLAVSTIKQIQPVVRVGGWTYEVGEVAEGLSAAFAQLVGSPLSTQET